MASGMWDQKDRNNQARSHKRLAKQCEAEGKNNKAKLHREAAKWWEAGAPLDNIPPHCKIPSKDW